MTINEMNVKMQQHYENAKEYAKAYNDAMDAKNLDKMNEAQKNLDNEVAEYVKMSQNITFEECKNAEDPMIEAIKRLTFKKIRAKLAKLDQGSDLKRMEVNEVEVPIDLAKLHEYCGGIGKDKDWVHAVAKFNELLTKKVNEDLGAGHNVSDDYRINKVAKEFNLGATPTSKTSLLKMLQKIISMMIGDEYKAVSHDVNFLLNAYTKNSKKVLTVSVSSHANMRWLMTEICYRLLNDMKYDVEYKKVKA